MSNPTDVQLTDAQFDALESMDIPEGATAESVLAAVTGKPAPEGSQVPITAQANTGTTSTPENDPLFLDAPPAPDATATEAAPASTTEAPAQNAPAPEWQQAFTALSSVIQQQTLANQQALAAIQQQIAIQQQAAAPRAAEPPPDPEPDPTDIIEYNAWLKRQLITTQQQLRSVHSTASERFAEMQRQEQMRAAQAEHYNAMSQKAVAIGNFLESAAPDVLRGTPWEGNLKAQERLLEVIAEDPIIARNPTADQLRARMANHVERWMDLVPRRQAPPPAAPAAASSSQSGGAPQVNEKYLDGLLASGQTEKWEHEMKRLASLEKQLARA